MTDSISNQKVKEGLLFRDIYLFREVLNPTLLTQNLEDSKCI